MIFSIAKEVARPFGHVHISYSYTLYAKDHIYYPDSTGGHIFLYTANTDVDILVSFNFRYDNFSKTAFQDDGEKQTNFVGLPGCEFV